MPSRPSREPGGSSISRVVLALIAAVLAWFPGSVAAQGMSEQQLWEMDEGEGENGEELKPAEDPGEKAGEPEPDDSMEQDDDVPEIAPLEVHGRKPFARADEDRAASATAIPRSEFSDAANTRPEVLDEQPGIRVSRLGGLGAFSTLSIRGSTADQVLVVLDGVVLNSAEGGPVDLSQLSLDQVERVEIYRGLAPTLFSTSAIGGVVSITSRKAQRRELNLTAGYGSLNTYRASVWYAEPHEKWGLTLGGDMMSSQGDFLFVNDQGTAFDPTDDTREHRANNSFRTAHAQLKLWIRLTPDIELTLFEMFSHQERGLPGIALWESTEAGLTTMRDIVSLRLNVRRLGGLEVDWRTQAYFTFNRVNLNDKRGEVGLGLQDTRDDSFAPGFSSFFKTAPTDWLSIGSSVAYRYEVFRPHNRAGATITATAAARHQVAWALETDFRVETIDTSFVPSLRVEYLHAAAEDGGPGGSGLLTDTTAPTYRLALINESIPYVRLTLNGSRSVRPPSLFELFGDTGYVLGNTGLRPEKAWTLDGGIIHEANWLPRPNRWQLEAYLFVTWVDDLIQFTQNAQNVAVAENVDRARLWGVEIGTRLDLFGHWRMRGNLTFLSSENRGDIAARTGKPLPHRPRFQAYLRTEGYWKTAGWLDEAALFVEVEWIDGNYLDHANLVRTDDRLYLGCGASLSLLDERMRVSFSARNLLDDRTQDFAGFPLPGRTYFGEITAKVF